MFFELHPFIQHLVTCSFGASILVSVWMIWKGPKDMDRMVALEWLGGLSIALSAWYALLYQDFKLIDIALVIATLSYLTTASLSKWFEAKELS
jgi:multisubunit Na+/H+ antiporter MnhF subunit